MSDNNLKSTPRLRLVMRIFGIAVAISPALLVLIAPPPYGYRVDYNNIKALGLFFFILSIPIGLFINSFGKNPTRTKQIFFIVVVAWLGLSALALIREAVSSLFIGTL